MLLEPLFFLWRKIRPKRKRDPPGQLRLERKQIRDLAIERVVPNMQVGSRIDELSIDPHSI